MDLPLPQGMWQVYFETRTIWTMEISLDQLLASRDARSQHQQQLMAQYPQHTLICLTVVMPGKVKRNRLSLTVAHAAVEALREAFAGRMDHWEEQDLPTGYEAYMATPMEPKECKAITCGIEDTHPLGRLFDVDVISASGIPLSRTELGFEPRRCLLCQREARYCMRNHTHTQEEIHQYIETQVSNWESLHCDSTAHISQKNI